MKNINLGAHFLFSSILCSTKIEWLLFLKFLKNLAFFDSYFWPFKKSEVKIKYFLLSVQSYLQSKMFLSNSIDMMKNLHLEMKWNKWESIFITYKNCTAQIWPAKHTLSRRTARKKSENFEVASLVLSVSFFVNSFLLWTLSALEYFFTGTSQSIK